MKKFTPIAMKCNQEQFKAIEPKLRGKINFNSANNFKKYPYLSNTSGMDNDGLCMSLNTICKDMFNYIWKEVETYDTWNEQIFLNACVIETDTYTVSKEFILDLHENVIWPSLRTKIENEFPDLFKKPKTKLTISEIEEKLGYEIEIVK
jgi:hypothetical protein